MDENVVSNSSGHFATVLSAERDPPANVRAECGITWLAWTAGGEGITWRSKSTSLNIWAHAPEPVSWQKGDYALDMFDPNALKSVIGEYYPSGRCISKVQVEALGYPQCRRAFPEGLDGVELLGQPETKNDRSRVESLL
jgi:hypothetical protein